MKLISYLFIVIFGGLLFFTSCKNDVSQEGVQIHYAKKGSGNVGQPGDFAIFNYEMSRNDTILRNSKMEGRPAIVKILSQEELTKLPSYNPVSQLLPTLKVGDSITVQIPVDSLSQGQGPSPYKDGYITMELGLNKLLNQKDFDVYLNQLKLDQKAKDSLVVDRFDEVSSITKSFLNKYLAGTADNIQTTPEGLKYFIIEKGNGKKPTEGDLIEAFYHGVIAKLDSKAENPEKVKSGDIFDSAFKPGKGQSFRFPLKKNRVISAWDIGFSVLSPGTKAILICPPNLAYGASPSGTIPANSELLFYVEFKDFITNIKK